MTHNVKLVTDVRGVLRRECPAAKCPNDTMDLREAQGIGSPRAKRPGMAERRTSAPGTEGCGILERSASAGPERRASAGQRSAPAGAACGFAERQPDDSRSGGPDGSRSGRLPQPAVEGDDFRSGAMPGRAAVGLTIPVADRIPEGSEGAARPPCGSSETELSWGTSQGPAPQGPSG